MFGDHLDDHKGGPVTTGGDEGVEAASNILWTGGRDGGWGITTYSGLWREGMVTS